LLPLLLLLLLTVPDNGVQCLFTCFNIFAAAVHFTLFCPSPRPHSHSPPPALHMQHADNETLEHLAPDCMPHSCPLQSALRGNKGIYRIA